MSTIFATRRGFLYQDRYAILTFLKYFQSKEIFEFYVDFSFGKSERRSVDIKAVLIDGTTIVYEVKSGENFKQDKRKKESSEIRDAFNEFIEYCEAHGESKMAFVITPELRGRVAEYWKNLMDLHQTTNFFSPNAKLTTKWLYLKLNLPHFTSHKMLYDFAIKLDIICGDSDIPDNDNDTYPPIDDLVSQKIKDLSRSFGADGADQELPCEMLYHTMLYLCQRYAGTNKDICGLLTDEILKFFSQKQKIGRTATVDLYAVQEEMKRFYDTWRKQTATPIQTPLPVTVVTADVTEGGVVNE